MSKLENGLNEWSKMGFISPEQAQQIRNYESSKSGNSWILSGLLILGALIISIGLISLIAANWQYIPDALKLGMDFAILISLAVAIVHFWNSERDILFELLLLFFFLICLGSIGLISQVFHTGGELYQALMMWSLITSGVAFASRKLFVPFVWVGTFLISLIFTAVDAVSFQSFFHKNYSAIYLGTTLLSACFLINIKSLFGEVVLTRAFRVWTLLGGLIALIVAELHHVISRHHNFGIGDYSPGYFLAALLGIGIWNSSDYRKIQKVILLLILGIFLIPFHFPLIESQTEIARAVFTIIIFGLMAVFMASIKEHRIFQFFLVFLGVRFLILYFQAFGGLATTGVGLILSGVLIIAMAILWNKYRTALAVWAEGIMQ